jgi:putative hydrolase of HD superfamily
MKNIADLLFEAKILKEIPRSGFFFLGKGKESVAEHSFLVTFIAYVMSEIIPDIDASRLITMCLVHDLPEARIGDLNYVQKKYVAADENQAVKDTTKDLPFGPSVADLIRDFKEGQSLESRLARDADQLALCLELKSFMDMGFEPSGKWLSSVSKRLKTKAGKKLYESIIKTKQDAWWLKNYVDE